MAEKRRLPARERREPAAKRRVSEATTSRRKASTPVVLPSPTPPPPEIPEDPLPTKIKDGEALPTTRAPQPAHLSDQEYQSIVESAVLLASLERSKKKWVSDGILERYWTKPKKSKRELIEKNNPPKESMTKVGACNIVIGPHLFDAMLYTVKDPNAQQQLQYMPPQRPPPAQHNNQSTFQQYQPYPHHQPAPPRPKHAHAPSNAPRQPTYPPGNSRPPPPQPQPQPQPQRPAQHAPSHPAPRQPLQQPAQPPKPSPDPVIQMLATRAASDPDLKALMRVVASSKASQEQLRAFQAHIDELNAIIKAREQQRQQSQAHTPNRQQPLGTASQPSSHQSQQQAQQSVDGAPPRPQTQQLAQSQVQPPAQQGPQQQRPQQDHLNHQQPTQPQVRPQSSTDVRPSPTNGQSPVPPRQSQAPSITVEIKKEPSTNAPTVSGHSPIQVQVPRSSVSSPLPTLASPSTTGQGQSTPVPHPASTQARPPPLYSVQQTGTQRPQGCQSSPYRTPPPPHVQPRAPPHGSSSSYRPAAPPPPPRINYKSVVLEFTSPLTPYGSSTSGHAGSGDRYLFPEHSILEWLPGGNTLIASFLVIRKVPPETPFPLEVEAEAAPTRAKAKGSKSRKADKKGKDETKTSAPSTPHPEGGPATSSGSSSQAVTADTKSGNTTAQPEGRTTSDKAASDQSPSTNAEKDGSASNLKEYYQPVTFRFFSPNPKTLEPLARVVKPVDEVRKYMNQIMDRAERAPEGFLALRLPREEARDETERGERDASTPVPGKGISVTGGRSRLLKGRAFESGEDSGVENNVGLVEEDVEVEEEEELKDFYDPPTGLVPLSI